MTTHPLNPALQTGGPIPCPQQRIVRQDTLDIGFAHDRTTGKEDWLTPPEIIRALGQFDLDPCSPIQRPWDTATRHYTLHENGLLKEWSGRVWLNPPYGNETDKWMRRLANHGNGIALIFARTETGTFFPWVWDCATAIMFLRGRICFYTKEGKKAGPAGAPSCLIAYGSENAATLARSEIVGKLLVLPNDGAMPRRQTEKEL
jgi:hypothetical protein